MKAILYFPAHPSYFGDRFTQAEIDNGIKLLDERYGGIIMNGHPNRKVPMEYRLLREPGKEVMVVFDATGFGGGRLVSEENQHHATEQFLRTELQDLKNLVGTLASMMERLRTDPELKFAKFGSGE